jgi:hypothetical protein
MGTRVARCPSMAGEQGNQRRGAHTENPAEREPEKNPSKEQDLSKPPAGRDEPPARVVKQGKRDPKSPWMGGG